jgi:thiamine biosynthesis protein ThiS
MAKLKYFFVNGQKYVTESDITISELMTYLNYNISLLVLEYNSLICNKKYWSNIFITNNDKFEIVTIVGGG